MAITLPTPGQSNWDTPLNDALFELQQDITDGANTFVSRVDADNNYARVNDARITNALQKANNLSEITAPTTARLNLGLGNSATKDVGTTSGTVAAGDALPTHVVAADPHQDRAYANATFLPLSGGTLTGSLDIGSGGLTLQSGGLVMHSGNISLTGDIIVTGNTTQTGTVSSYGFSANSTRFAASVGGDSVDRFHINSDGGHEWGDGTLARDTVLYRLSANTLATDDDFVFTTAGKGLKIKEGSNAKMGIVTLSSGAATVNTTAVTANTRIFLTVQTAGGTQGFLRISARVANTSFTITSTSATETSTVAWLLVEPA